MDPFARASKFFSEAFLAQESAAQNQTRAQRSGMEKDRYGSQIDDAGLSGPVPPQNGPYGTFQNPLSPTDDPVESMKSEMLVRARANRQPTDGQIALRSGGGINTAVRY